MFDLLGSPVVSALVALAPALFYWVSARRLERDVADPILPERLLALQRRSGAVLAFALAILIVASYSTLLWSVPLVILGRVVAGYPLRRTLYGETWSIVSYLSFTARTIAAFSGFWIALAMMPVAAGWAGSLDWLAGIAIALALVVWNRRFPQTVRRMFRVEPLKDEALLARFTKLANDCGLPATRFEVIDLRGGAILNALALASPKQPAVVFTSTMLERLEPDEVYAICAHEMAHLEYYNPVRLRRIATATSAFIALGVSVAPLSRFFGEPVPISLTLWLLALLLFLVVLARHRQKNETDSDKRAVALCGDPEALVRALTKAYAFNRFPRRLDTEIERHATHPSLARRIRDIRAAAARPAETFTGSLSVTCSDGSVLTLESTRLAWSDPDGTMHAVPYDQLVELRIDANGRRGPRLVATQKSRRRWLFKVDPSDVARVQEVLDAVDGQLAEPAPADHWGGVSRVVTSLGAVIALSAGMLVVGIVAVLAAMRPSRQLLAAVGFGSLAGAGLLLRDLPFEAELLAAATLGLTMLGVVWIFLAARTPAAEVERTDMLMIGLIGVGAVVAAAVLLMNGADAVALHQNALSMPGGVSLIAAASGLLAFSKARWKRGAAAAVGTAALAAASVGTPTFLETFGHDPLLLQSPPFERHVLTGQPSAEFSVPFSVSELRISPQGRRIALASYEGYGPDSEGTAFHVGRPGQQLTRVVGLDVVFLDDDHVMVMKAKMGRVILEALAFDAPDRVLWQTELHDVFGPQLVVSRDGRRWAVLGTDQEQQIIRFAGVVGEAGNREMRWNVSRSDMYPATFVGSASEVLVVETDFGLLSEEDALSPFALLRILNGGGPGVRWWRTGQPQTTVAGSSRLWTTCSKDGAPDDQLLCGAFDGRRTRMALIDSATGQVTPVGWIQGRFLNYGRGSGGWATGFAESTAIALHVDTRQAVEIGAGHDSDSLSSISATNSIVGGVWLHPGSTTVRLYRRATPLIASSR